MSFVDHDLRAARRGARAWPRPCQRLATSSCGDQRGPMCVSVAARGFSGDFPGGIHCSDRGRPAFPLALPGRREGSEEHRGPFGFVLLFSMGIERRSGRGSTDEREYGQIRIAIASTGAGRAAASDPRRAALRLRRALPRSRRLRRAHIERAAAHRDADDVSDGGRARRRGERALQEQRWKDAAAAYRTLVAADATPEHAPEYRFDLGLSLEGAQSRAEARDTFLDLVRRFPEARRRGRRSCAPRRSTRTSKTGRPSRPSATRSSRGPDLEDLERIVALGARGLARVERGERGTPEPRGAPPRTSTTASIWPTSSTTATATCSRWPSRSCASPSASSGASGRSGSTSTRCPPTSSPSSTSAAPAFSKRRPRTRRPCGRSTRTGPPCPGTAWARCTGTFTAT